MIAMLPCLYCRHYNPDDLDKTSCTAFPDGIPDRVFHGWVDHRQSYPGDHGVRFEPSRPGAEEDYDRLFEPEEKHRERMQRAYDEYERKIREQHSGASPLPMMPDPNAGLSQGDE